MSSYCNATVSEPKAAVVKAIQDHQDKELEELLECLQFLEDNIDGKKGSS
jgi:hypothetical protein